MIERRDELCSIYERMLNTQKNEEKKIQEKCNLVKHIAREIRK